MSGKTAGNTFIDHSHGIVRVQGLEMRTSDLKINHTNLCVELLIQETGSIFDKLGKGSVHFSKGLLILTLDHHLRLGLQRLETNLLDRFNREVLAFGDFHADTCGTALRVRDAVNTTALACMLTLLILALAACRREPATSRKLDGIPVMPGASLVTVEDEAEDDAPEGRGKRQEPASNPES